MAGFEVITEGASADRGAMIPVQLFPKLSSYCSRADSRKI